MSQNHVTLEQVIALARQLDAADKLRLVEQVLPELEGVVKAGNETVASTWYGALSNLGVAPSAEDIDQARAEMFGNFPRNDMT
jgi:hypothetical protein